MSTSGSRLEQRLHLGDGREIGDERLKRASANSRPRPEEAPVTTAPTGLLVSCLAGS
jgi:hypothetical protein